MAPRGEARGRQARDRGVWHDVCSCLRTAITRRGTVASPTDLWTINEICKNYSLGGGSGRIPIAKTYESVYELTSSVEELLKVAVDVQDKVDAAGPAVDDLDAAAAVEGQ